MTQYTVTGRTFEHRDLLKAWRGRFDQETKAWQLDLSTAQVDTLRRMVGIVVTETPPAPEPERQTFDFSELIRRIGDDEPNRAAHRNGRSAIYGDDPRWFNYFRDQNPTAFFRVLQPRRVHVLCRPATAPRTRTG